MQLFIKNYIVSCNIFCFTKIPPEALETSAFSIDIHNVYAEFRSVKKDNHYNGCKEGVYFPIRKHSFVKP